MSDAFKFRFVNEIVGVFVLLVIVLLIAGIVLAGQAQGWFKPRYEISVSLPPEGSFGLREGAEVQVLQTPVGLVHRIVVRDDGEMEARLRIQGEFTRFVREDSVATIRKKFTVAGDAYVEISRGKGEALPRRGAHIACRTDADLIMQVQGALEDVRFNAVEAMDRLKALVAEHTALAAQLRSPEGSLQQLLSNLDTITAGLAKGEGTAGRLLRDPSAADELERLLASLNDTVKRVGAVLESLEGTVDVLPDIAHSVDRQLQDVPQLVRQAERTLLETERLIRGFQQHWLVRKYIEEEDATGRLPLDTLGVVPAGAE